MEFDRNIVRRKLEELMQNPLAKELWTTEVENFDDPTYHPTLILVVDSDDVLNIDVEEFEKFYSNEEANYWNGIMCDTARRFDAAKTGINRLTCVYRDGQWLDVK